MLTDQDGTGNGIGLAFVFMVVEDIFKAQIDFPTSDQGTPSGLSSRLSSVDSSRGYGQLGRALASCLPNLGDGYL